MDRVYDECANTILSLCLKLRQPLLPIQLLTLVCFQSKREGIQATQAVFPGAKKVFRRRAIGLMHHHAGEGIQLRVCLITTMFTF